MIKNWKELSKEEKSNEVPHLAELRGVGYSWDEIGEFYGASSATIKGYYNDHKLLQTAELAESIINGNSKIEISTNLLVDLLDRMNDMEAKFKSLEADVIKASTIHSNELKSDKKYIVTRFSTREFISYANEDELNRYITVYGNRIPIATIDNGIKEKSNWVCRPDDIMITFTVQNVIDDVDLQTKILSNQHSELQNTIRDIQELMR